MMMSLLVPLLACSSSTIVVSREAKTNVVVVCAEGSSQRDLNERANKVCDGTAAPRVLSCGANETYTAVSKGGELTTFVGSCCHYECPPIVAPLQEIPKYQTGDIQPIQGTSRTPN